MKNKKVDEYYIDFELKSGRKKYFITIQDEFGREIKMEVNAAIFHVFDEERKDDESRRKEVERHYDNRGLEEYIFSREMIRRISKSPEEIYLNKEIIEEIMEVLDQCTPTQRRRFCLNKAYGYTLEEIAKIEGCSFVAVHKSVNAVAKKIKNKIFSDGGLKKWL